MKTLTVVNAYDIGTGCCERCHTEKGRSLRAQARAARYLAAIVAQDHSTDVVYYVAEVVG